MGDKPEKPEAQTYYRNDPITGEVHERTVVTARDKVEAKYSGYHPKSESGSKKPASGSTGGSSTPAKSE